MQNYQPIPRIVFFKNGKAIAAVFVSLHSSQFDNQEIIDLPTDHFDFLGPIQVKGKTKNQILQEIKDNYVFA